jgi:hypothetical protein
MSKLVKQFSFKEWNDCCGKFCSGCEIAALYKKKFGKKKGERKLREARKKIC